MGKKKGGGGGKGKQHRGGSSQQKKQKENSPVVTKKKPQGKTYPVPGLMNLGNTCFFNSVMQSIGQSHYLRARLDRLMTSPKYDLELKTPDCQLQLSVEEAPGSLTKTLHTFLGEMVSHPARALNPRPLFSQICQKAPRFRSFQQQDSQELLRYLLDSLKMEEVHRIKRAILVAHNVSGKTANKEAKNKLTDKDRENIKAFGHQAQLSHTFVDEVFGGSLISTVTCNQCHSCTTVHENYLDLSLPIAPDKSSKQSSPGGRYQLRERKSKRNARDSKRDGEGEDEEEEESEVLLSPKAAATSKHQQKKARQKERKKKPVKKSLQEFMQSTETQEQSKEKGKEEKEEEKKGAEVTEQRKEEGKVMEGKKQGEEDGQKEEEVEEKGGRSGRLTPEEGGTERGKEGEGAVVEKTAMEGREGGMTDCSQTVQDSVVEEKTSFGRSAGKHPLLGMASVKSSGEMRGGCKGGGGEGGEGRGGEGEVQREVVDSLSAAVEAMRLDGGDEGTAMLPNHLGDERENPPTNPTPESTQIPSSTPQTTGEVALETDTLPSNTTKATPLMLQPCSSLESVSHSADSIEGCLKKFCSPETLTGSNKFACMTCTERKVAVKQERSEEEMGEGSEEGREGRSEEGREGRSEEKAESSVSEIVMTPETGEGGEGEVEEEREVDAEEGGEEEGEGKRNGEGEGEGEGKGEGKGDGEGGGENEVDDQEKKVMEADLQEGEEAGREVEGEDGDSSVDESKNGGNSSHEESAKESDNEGDELLRDSKETTPTKPKSTAGKEIVFCEATKQMMIRKLPQVLTLHLKRFLQDGRRLRKNGRHISFPTLLNLSPFCTTDCQVHCDSNGRILYSLYGVVEHAGGMQGGHYTAYVRVRKTALPSVDTGDGVRQQESAVKGKEEGVATSVVGSCGMTTEGQSSTTEDHRVTTEEPPATTNSSHGNGVPTNTHDSGVTMDTNGDYSNPSVTTKDQSLTNGTKPSCLLPPSTTPSTAAAATASPVRQEFDMSSISGQWYYISDTQVRTATESEVQRSQAYLLFYERLPFLRD